MNKENQCQSFTLKNTQCKNKCVDNFCRVHDPKECEKREKVRRLYREIEERSYRYLKYVEREVKKSRIRHRRWVERVEKKKTNPNVQCKALTKKGLPCRIAAKSEYCHVHKYLDINSNEIKAETDAVMFKYPDDFGSLMNELLDQFYKIQPRSYIGPEIDIHKIEKINNLYIEEKELVMDVYDSFVSKIANCSNFDDLGNIDDFRNRITVSVNEVYEKTDASILSDNLDSASLLENEFTIFIKEVEKESHNIELRSYSGPELDSFALRRINRVYASEKKSKGDTYDGYIKMLSCYTNFEELGGNASYIKDEIAKSFSILEKETDATVEALIPPKESTPLSKYY